MEPARGESFPSGQRRGPAAPGEDKLPSLCQKPFHISTTPTTRGRKIRSPGPIPPHTVWKPQLHWVIADWLGLMEPTRGESCPSGNAEVPPHPGRISSHPRVSNPSIYIQLQRPGDQNPDPPGRYLPAGCGNPNPTGWLLIGWGSWSQRAARVSSWGNVEVPPHPERIGSHARIQNTSVHIQLQQPGDENEDLPGQCRPAGCGSPNPTG